MNANWATVSASALAALATVIAAFVTKGQIDKARAKEDRAGREQNAVTGFVALTEELRREVIRLREDVGKLQSRVDTLEDERERDRVLIARLQREQQLNRTWIAGARDYIRRLLDALRSAGITAPQPSGGWEFDPDEGR